MSYNCTLQIQGYNISSVDGKKLKTKTRRLLLEFFFLNGRFPVNSIYLLRHFKLENFSTLYYKKCILFLRQIRKSY